MKRFIALLLCCAMLIVVAGCGAHEENSTRIVCGSAATMIIKPDGTLWYAGSYVVTPAISGHTDGFIKIADNIKDAGFNRDHTLILTRDGTVKYFEELDPNSDFKFDILTRNVKAMSVGVENSAFILSDNSLWYLNTDLYLDIDTDNYNPYDWSKSVKIADFAKAVSTNNDAVLFTDKNDTLYGWGENAWAQLGDGTLEHRDTPVEIMSNVKEFCVALYSSFAIDSNNTLWAWGANTMKVLGTDKPTGSIQGFDETSDEIKPVKILENIEHIAVRAYSAFAVTTEGKLIQWGQVFSVKYYIDGPSSKKLDLDDNVKSIFCNELNNVIYEKNDGSIWAIGYNKVGQKGVPIDENNNGYISSPQKILDSIDELK